MTGMPQPTPYILPVPPGTWPAPRPAPDRETMPLRRDSNIQGNVLAGFNKDHQVLLFVTWPNADAGRAWLTALRPTLSTNDAVASFNARFSADRRRSGSDPANLFTVWSNVSFTAEGLKVLVPEVLEELAANKPLDAGIQLWLDGSSAVAERLGDSGVSDPITWLFGARPVHAVVCIAADRPDDLAIELANHRELAAHHDAEIVFEQPGGSQLGAAAGREHFGFKDGISQPGVSGFDPPSPDNPAEVDGKPGTELIAAGTFILGYPRDSADPIQAPRWMFDGSFLVTRRIVQDVPGFWAGVGEQHARLTRASITDPTSGIPTADALAAKLVGRWPSGTPTDHAPVYDNRAAQDPTHDNAFTFEGDPNGDKTPFCAHIRKVNPRKGAATATHPVTEDETKKRRILRRGIPFGPTFEPGTGKGHGVDTKRGLLFQCYQASLDEQFAYLQQFWVNKADFPDPETGNDAVIGAASTVSIRAAETAINLDLADFVRTEGSVFAFTPSLETVSALASGTPLTAPREPTEKSPTTPGEDSAKVRRALESVGQLYGRDPAATLDDVRALPNYQLIPEPIREKIESLSPEEHQLLREILDTLEKNRIYLYSQGGDSIPALNPVFPLGGY